MPSLPEYELMEVENETFPHSNSPDNLDSEGQETKAGTVLSFEQEEG